MTAATNPLPPLEIPPYEVNPLDYTLYTVQGKYYVKSKLPGSKEQQITQSEYNDLLEMKNNKHARQHKNTE